MDNHNGHNILLVDDDIEQASLIKQILEASPLKNITVFWYKNDTAALDFLVSESTPIISLVLLEIQCNSFNGILALKQLKKDSSPHKLIPIIVFSKSKDFTKIKQCFSLGVNSWVRKPSDSNMLQETLEAILDFWLTHAVLPVSLI